MSEVAVPDHPLRLLAVNHTAMVSGAELVLRRLLTHACRRDWTVVLAAPQDASHELHGRTDEPGLPPSVSRIRLPELTLPFGPLPLSATALAAREIVAAQRLRRAATRADVILANGIRTLPSLWAARPAAPVVWLVHSVIDRRRWQRIARFCTGTVDAAIAVSEVTAASLGPAGFPVQVIWNGTPWPVEPAGAEGPEPPVVGCAALLTAWKGQHVLLEAAARLSRRDVVFELMGGSFPKDGRYVEALRRRAAQKDLAGRVRFLGHVEDPLARMRQWSVAVVASVDPDAGPLTVLEAMSVGVPVAATDHGGAREVIGGAGILVPPNDPAALASAIERLLDPIHRRACGAVGRRTVADRFTLTGQLDAALEAVAARVARNPLDPARSVA